MLGQCAGPIWNTDDFTRCFRREYLLTIFPLVACLASLLVLVTQYTVRALRARRYHGYTPLANGVSEASNAFRAYHARPETSPGAEGEPAEDADLESPAREVTEPHLSKAVLTETVVNRPRAELLVCTLEVLCLFGLVAICLATLVSGVWGASGRPAAISALATWSYVTVLACSRLVCTYYGWKSAPGVWYHTAVLYGLQWIFAAILLRSVLIHPLSNLSRDLVVAKFALVTVLFLVALTTRRGNREIVLTYVEGVRPSPEPLASLLSLATFSWLDPLVWQGYRKPLEIGDVYNVLPHETAFKLLDDFRTLKRSQRLAFRLVRFFAPSLLTQQAWSLLNSILTFTPPLLLRAIIEYVEDPTQTSPSRAWLNVILLPIVITMNGVADGQALWRGRKICIMLRAIMVGEIYAKTLRRKAASSGDTDMNADEKGAVNPAKGQSWRDWMAGLFKRSEKTKRSDDAKRRSSSPVGPETEDTQVNSGTIINLMSVDSFKVAEISAYWHFLVPMVPVELAIAITLLVSLVGWSAFAGLIVMAAVLPLNIFFSTQFSRAYKRIMSATDARIHTTSELLQNVRIVKYFAWEERFSHNVHEKRNVELKAIARRCILWTLAASLWYSVPVMITGFTFMMYTLVEKKPLYPSVAFTALSLFTLLRAPLDRLADMLAHVLESKASVDRVEKFLNEEETAKYQQLSRSAEVGFLGFKKANFAWSHRARSSFRLINLDIAFRIGGLNVIAGPTGSGKTSLLMALLGEMTLLDGSVHLPGGYDRSLLACGSDGLTESVAYCAQQPWLVNDTIKQNIVFAGHWNEQRYRQVLAACALERDLEVLEQGDETLVGEKGIVVSGGQKQRISLARALYSNARHVLLDDCLSAVDSHTAQHLFERCINGPLMFGRTCILVTHNVALCVPQAHHVVVLRNGKVAAQGGPESVIATGVLGEDVQKVKPVSKDGSRVDGEEANGSPNPSERQDVPNGQANDSPNGQANGHVPNGDKKTRQEVKDANTRTEKKAEGSVGWQVIKLYLTAMGPWWFWTLILLAFVLDNVSNVSTNVWIRQWANHFHRSEAATSTRAAVAWFAPTRQLYMYASPTSADPQPVNSGFYLGIYALLACTYILIALTRLGVIFWGGLRAARKVHTRLLDSVLRAKFKFFDTTPLGQITNRFSKDLQAIDQDIVIVAASMMQSLFGLLSVIILISVITPGFLVAGALLTGVYLAVGAFYIQSSRDLKRLESVQRSPLYQQFGETLSGIVTIRAYGDARRFADDNAQRVNRHNRPFIFLWAANRWLALRVEFAGAAVSFFAAVFIMLRIGSLDPGAAGLSLTYALSFNENILWLVRLYAENEQNMNHVERVKQFLEIEQEAPQHIPETQPAADWPSQGAVEFQSYSTRYRPDLEPVLRDLSFTIQAGEKVGIVGRTGAGKSSLAMALFRGLEATDGRICIDGIDVGTIGLQDLRQNLTIVPQDPTLFTGTIRSNLDPFDVFSDDQIFAALRQVNLIDVKGESVPVAKPVETEGARIEQAIETAEAEDIDRLGRSPEARGLPFMGRRPSQNAERPLSPPSLSLAATHASSVGAEVAPTDTNQSDNANAFTNLLSPVAEAGGNLSQGQRQLLCLARALLAAPRVLVMDEATASIDYATDARIQAALRSLRGRTLITIAHRLRTIVDYDQVLVLDHGRLVEFGPPWELIAKEGGMFRGQCETSGEFEALVEGARVAEVNKRLST